jgi:hypothetical protein
VSIESPSQPTSEPANSVGTPGIVNSATSPTVWRTRSPPTTVRRRAVSCESSIVIDACRASHETFADRCRIDSTRPYPSRSTNSTDAINDWGAGSFSQAHNGRVNHW